MPYTGHCLFLNTIRYMHVVLLHVNGLNNETNMFIRVTSPRGLLLAKTGIDFTDI